MDLTKRWALSPPHRWSKTSTVHQHDCRHAAWHDLVAEDQIPADATDCKVCGGRTP